MVKGGSEVGVDVDCQDAGRPAGLRQVGRREKGWWKVLGTSHSDRGFLLSSVDGGDEPG